MWQLPKQLPSLAGSKMVAVDLETHDPTIKKHGPGVRRDGRIIGISVGVDGGGRWYLPFGHPQGMGAQFEEEKVKAWAKAELCRPGQAKVGANIMYDLDYLWHWGVPVTGPYYDVQIAEPLLDENARSYSLDTLSLKYLNEGKASSLPEQYCEERKWKGDHRAHLWRMPPSIVGPYAEADADLPLRILPLQMKRLAEEDLSELFDMETRLVPMMLAMRQRGVRIDVPAAEAELETIVARAMEVHARVNEIAGQHIDIWTRDSIASAYNKLGIEYPRTRKTGAPSFTKHFLEVNGGPLGAAILEARQLDKLRGTFMKGHLLGPHLVDGRIHCAFNQLRGDEYGTVTGRFSSCVAEGTLIDIVRDSGKYPKGKPIEDVREGDLAYCYDQKKRLTLRRVRWAGKTGRKRVLRIHWQGTGRHTAGHLDVTPEHRIRLVSGDYVRADELVVGDKTLALSRSLTNGYPRLHITGAPEQRENVFIGREILGAADSDVVHHKNGDKMDNRRENLEVMPRRAHSRLHAEARDEETTQRMAETLRRLYREGKIHHKILKGEAHPSYIGLSRIDCLRLLLSAGGRVTEIGMDFNTFKKKAAACGIDIDAVRRRFGADGEFITLGRLRRAALYDDAAACEALRIGTRAYHALLKAMGIPWARSWANQFGSFVPGNHRITRIETLRNHVDVYDIQMEEHHNFIANEICVHNSNPNLQQIPKRGILGDKLRSFFVPEPGELWGRADYSQVEIRILAHYAKGGGAEEIRKALNDNPDLDYHATCAQWAGIERDQGKCINFGIIYGEGRKKLAKQLGLGEAEAMAILNTYYRKLPFLKGTSNLASQTAADRGYVFTLLKRRRRFNEWEPVDWDLSHDDAFHASEVDKTNRKAVLDWVTAQRKENPGIRWGVKRAWTYRALNAIIQGSAADLFKKGLVDIWEAGICDVLGPPLVLVHDELCASVPNTKEGREAWAESVHLMENALPQIRVPIRVDAALKKDWGTPLDTSA